MKRVENKASVSLKLERKIVRWNYGECLFVKQNVALYIHILCLSVRCVYILFVCDSLLCIYYIYLFTSVSTKFLNWRGNKRTEKYWKFIIYYAMTENTILKRIMHFQFAFCVDNNDEWTWIDKLWDSLEIFWNRRHLFVAHTAQCSWRGCVNWHKFLKENGIRRRVINKFV